jgi:hypothetical protein
MSKRVGLVSAVVVVALVAAVLGATAALRLIGVGAVGPGGRPLSETDVHRSLDARTKPGVGTPASPAPTPSGSAPSSGAPGASGGPGHSPAARLGAFTSAAGTVLASCASGQATMNRWIPASGYSTDGYGLGPARSVWVKFKSGGSEQTVTVDCVAGEPHLVTSVDDHGGGGAGGGAGGGGDDHGGGREGGGRGGDGSGGGSGGGGSGGSGGGSGGSGGGGRSGGK